MSDGPSRDLRTVVLQGQESARSDLAAGQSPVCLTPSNGRLQSLATDQVVGLTGMRHSGHLSHRHTMTGHPRLCS